MIIPYSGASRYGDTCEARAMCMQASRPQVALIVAHLRASLQATRCMYAVQRKISGERPEAYLEVSGSVGWRVHCTSGRSPRSPAYIRRRPLPTSSSKESKAFRSLYFPQGYELYKPAYPVRLPGLPPVPRGRHRSVRVGAPDTVRAKAVGLSRRT